MKPHELAEFFHESLCIFELKATTKPDALREMVGCIGENLRFKDKVLLLDMLVHRESLGSTAIAKGVAFPHGRSLAIRELTVLFARSAKGLDFDALDSKPTHLFFLIVAPPQDKDNLYLQVLGHLVELIKSAPLRKQLMEVTTFRELQDTLASA